MNVVGAEVKVPKEIRESGVTVKPEKAQTNSRLGSNAFKEEPKRSKPVILNVEDALPAPARHTHKLK